MCASLTDAISATSKGLVQAAALRSGTLERGVAHQMRLKREQQWLGAAEERLAQQRASHARLYVAVAARGRCCVRAYGRVPL